MLSNFVSTLLLTLLTLAGLSTALQYDLVCNHGISAAQCSSAYGTYCTSHGTLTKPAPSGLDCTTNRSPVSNGGVYCYCKFRYIAPPKATGKFNPNEILQQREEANVQAVPLPTPTFDPNEILQWTRDIKERADAIREDYPLPTPTFDPTEILQWTRDIKDASEDKNEVRDDHFENATQLPTGAINSAYQQCEQPVGFIEFRAWPHSIIHCTKHASHNYYALHHFQVLYFSNFHSYSDLATKERSFW